MWPTYNPVIAAVTRLAVLDLQYVAITDNFDLVFIIRVKLLCALIPGQCDLWVVDLDLTFKHSLLVNDCCLISDVSHKSNRLKYNNIVMLMS